VIRWPGYGRGAWRWPGYLKRDAHRQLLALDYWSDHRHQHYYSPAVLAYNAAQGFYAARDWMGVSAQYHKVSKLIEDHP
jgi:hypothetical protein